MPGSLMCILAAQTLVSKLIQQAFYQQTPPQSITVLESYASHCTPFVRQVCALQVGGVTCDSSLFFRDRVLLPTGYSSEQLLTGHPKRFGEHYVVQSVSLPHRLFLRIH